MFDPKGMFAWREPRDLQVSAEQLQGAAERRDFAAPDFFSIEEQAGDPHRRRAPELNAEGLRRQLRRHFGPRSALPQNHVQAIGDRLRGMGEFDSGRRCEVAGIRRCAPCQGRRELAGIPRCLFLTKLADYGIDDSRVRLEWVSASEGQRFADIVNDMTQRIRERGPSPIRAALASDMVER